MQPHRIANWQDGVVLAVLQKADILEEYEAECASPSVSLQIPAVLRLRKEIHANKKGTKFSRSNIYQRDGHKCCYCNKKFAARDLTYDHVVPRCRGGKTDWLGIVSACKICNVRKGNKTPAEAGMRQHYLPYKPRVLPMTAPFLVSVDDMPEQWLPYVRSYVHQAAG
jgi:5-methylcytosine-specific restriction endonuclease McrA